MDPTFPARVAELLAEHQVPASLLTLEITEDGMIREPDRPMAALNKLSEMGVRLAVDDFGAGYSSLSYLRRLPVDEVKIDRSFVTGMATDAGDLAIVRAVVDLAGHFDGHQAAAEVGEGPLIARDILLHFPAALQRLKASRPHERHDALPNARRIG